MLFVIIECCALFAWGPPFVVTQFVLKKITVYLDTVESLIKLRDPHLVAQPVKNLPAMREIQVQSLGWEDPLEKATATHSSIFAWRIPWTEDPGGLYSTGPKESDMIE